MLGGLLSKCNLCGVNGRLLRAGPVGRPDSGDLFVGAAVSRQAAVIGQPLPAIAQVEQIVTVELSPARRGNVLIVGVNL